MEAGDPGAGGVAGDGRGQASAGGPGGQGGPGGPGGPGRGGSGEAGAVPREAPQAALGAAMGGSNGEPAPAARAPRPVPLQFVLLVQFRSPMDAEFACHCLVPSDQPQPAAVHQEITVSGRVVTIRLTAEDMDQLRLSITSCLQEIFQLLQNMWHTMPSVYFVSSMTENED